MGWGLGRAAGWIGIAISVCGCSDTAPDLGQPERATAAVVVGSELQGDDVVPTRTRLSDFSTTSAFDGTNHLVVWIEEGHSLVGARVTPTGTVLDPVGFPIAPRVTGWPPSVAYGGGTCLVVWDDPAAGVSAVRVSSNTILDATPLSIGAGAEASVGFDGANFVVSWIVQDSLTQDRVFAARVSPAGVVLDPAGTEVVSLSGDRTAPRVAGGSGQSLVCWEDERNSPDGDVFCSRISGGGAVLDPEGFDLTAGFPADEDRGPAIAHDGTNWLVVWQRGPSASGSVVGVRVDATGTKVDTSLVSIASGGGSHRQPDVAFDGTQWFVAWHDDGGTDIDVAAARVQSDGTVLDTPQSIDVTTAIRDQYSPAVSAGGGGALVTWSDYRDDITSSFVATDVYAARLDGAGALLDGPAATGGILLSLTANPERRPVAAWSGTAWLVVWEDWRDESADPDLWGARYDASGTLLDTSAVAIAQAAGSQSLPSVASDGSGWLVAYVHQDAGLPQVRTTRVDASGTVLDGANGVPISPVSALQYLPAVAWGGTSWLVAFVDGRNPLGNDVRGVRLDGAGNLLSELVIADASRGLYFAPAVEFDGTRYLVAWADNNFGSVAGARVEPDGTVLDTTPVQIASNWEAIDEMRPTGPRIASAGSGWMVVWEANGDVLAALVDTDGTLQGASFPLAASTSAERWPTVTHDGQQFHVVWKDDASANATGEDLRGVFVSDTGTVLNAAPVDVSALPGDEDTPSLAGAASGTSLVAYQRFDVTSPYRNDRMRARIVESGAAVGAACTSDSDCVTRRCSMSVCVLPPVDAGVEGGGGAAGTAGASGAAGAGGGARDAGDASAGASGTVDGGLDGGVDGGGASGGLAGSGGDGATAGSAGSGATTSSAGSAGAAGSQPAGGAGGIVNGMDAGADGAANAPGNTSKNDGGCGCRVRGGPSAGSGAWALLGLLLLRRRRPRHRRRRR